MFDKTAKFKGLTFLEVKEGKVIVIYFPNDGYLDDDHIYPTELELGDDEYVEIEEEEGKTYEIQIDY